MQNFRFILVVMSLVIVIVTIAALANEGANLVSPFLLPIVALTWQGQFNVDFTCYLILSGIWMAWRGGFTSGSIALGALAAPLGMFFFAPYLIYLIGKANGDPRQLLLGVHAG